MTTRVADTIVRLPWLALLVGVGLVLRVGTILILPPYAWFDGGDGPYYARQAWLIANGAPTGPMQTVGPLYPLGLAAIWLLFPHQPDPAAPETVATGFLMTVRLVQALIGALTTVLVFALGRALGLRREAALAGAGGVSLGPAFVIESFMVRTETLGLFLFAGAVLAYLRARHTDRLAPMVGAGVVCAAAALSRPMLLLFPVAIAAHALIVDGRPGGRRRAAALLAAAVVTLAPWHLWLHAASGSWLPAGLSANLLHGAYSHGGPPDPVTFHALERRAADAGRGILGEATHLIAADPMGWVVRRARNVAGALAQPHGTSDLGGPSVRAALGDWVRGDRSTSELRPIVTTWGFAIRVIVYLFHYAGLALAVAGLSLTRRDWRTWLPLWIAIAYVVGLHAVLTASPRYLFLIQPFVWVLAAAALSVAAGWFFQPVLSYNRR